MRETMTGIPSSPLSRSVVFRSPIGIVLLLLALLSLCLALFPRLVGAQAAVIFVDDTAEGSNDGTSWADAYTDLQAALEQATGGEEIWVAAGVYLPTQTGDRSASFELRSGVAMYGGFAGTETLRSERDWSTNLAILSGDIDFNDANATDGLVRDAADIRGDNSYHVVSANSSIAATTALDGFYISGGAADGLSLDGRGAGINCIGCAATFSHLAIVGNRANSGAGMLAYPSSATLDGLVVAGNSATNGGGIYSSGGSLTLSNVLIYGNRASVNGGGIYSNNCSHRLTNVTVVGNGAQSDGGGLYLRGTGGLTVSNCIVWGNTAVSSQQVHNASTSVGFAYCDIQGSGGSGASWLSSLGRDDGGNIDVNPLFETDMLSYRLEVESPAIEAGSNALVPAWLHVDLDGHPRISDGDDVVGAIVDMGAYEWPGYGLTVDVVGSGQVTESRDSGTFPFIQSLYYPPGYSVTVTAEPAEGWTFAGWSGDVTGSQPTADILMTASKVVTATFTGPAAVTMGSFAARSTSAGILLTWETESEIDMLGFYLRRSESFDGPREDLNGGQMIPVVAPGQMEGSRYRFLDSTVVSGERYVYQLEQVGLGFLENSPNAIHTVEARHWGFFWFLPIVTHPMMVGP